MPARRSQVRVRLRPPQGGPIRPRTTVVADSARKADPDLPAPGRSGTGMTRRGQSNEPARSWTVSGLAELPVGFPAVRRHAPVRERAVVPLDRETARLWEPSIVALQFARPRSRTRVLPPGPARGLRQTFDAASAREASSPDMQKPFRLSMRTVGREPGWIRLPRPTRPDSACRERHVGAGDAAGCALFPA